jgi:hypothetical protein
MNTTSLTKLACGIAAASALLALHANANPLVTGDIDFTGSVTLDNPIPGSSVIMSVGGKVQAGSQSGDYFGVPSGTAVSFSTPLDFVALESVSPSTITPWWTFTVGTATYSFSIVGDVFVHQYVAGDGSFLDISGSGDAAITGYATNDNATFDISIGKTGSAALTFGDSNAATTPAVPDGGTTGLLIGLGLTGIGVGLVAQRKRLLTRAD